jgi:hypothetical protein
MATSVALGSGAWLQSRRGGRPNPQLLGVWAAPAAPQTLPNGGVIRPLPFGRVMGPLGPPKSQLPTISGLPNSHGRYPCSGTWVHGALEWLSSGRRLPLGPGQAGPGPARGAPEDCLRATSAPRPQIPEQRYRTSPFDSRSRQTAVPSNSPVGPSSVRVYRRQHRLIREGLRPRFRQTPIKVSRPLFGT